MIRAPLLMWFAAFVVHAALSGASVAFHLGGVPAGPTAFVLVIGLITLPAVSSGLLAAALGLLADLLGGGPLGLQMLAASLAWLLWRIPADNVESPVGPRALFLTLGVSVFQNVVLLAMFFVFGDLQSPLTATDVLIRGGGDMLLAWALGPFLVRLAARAGVIELAADVSTKLFQRVGGPRAVKARR